MNLEKIRNEIDEVDRKIIRLLKKRVDLAMETIKFKSQAEDLLREKEVFLHITDLADECNLDKKYLHKLYEIIIRESKIHQNK